MTERNRVRTDVTHVWGMRAGLAAFASLAVVIPHVVIAEIDREAMRGERLATPVGADGPSNPILSSLRVVERVLSTMGPHDKAGMRRSSVPAARAALPGFAAQSDEPSWPRVLSSSQTKDFAGPIILAALDQQPLAKAPPAQLGWAAVPAVPTPLTRPFRETAPAVARLELPPRRPRMASTKGGALGVASLSQKHRISTRARLAMTTRGMPEWLAPAGQNYARSSDPIGDLAASLSPAPAARPAGPAFILPFENGRVTSLFNQGRRHPAIDLAGRHGAPVYATSHGQTVTFTGWRGGYGNAVITRDREGREHLYGHLSGITTRPGAVLAQGDRLGLLGSTGHSTGPHVHYEVKDRRGAHINPVVLLFPQGVSNGYAWAGTGIVRGAGGQASAEIAVRARNR